MKAGILATLSEEQKKILMLISRLAPVTKETLIQHLGYSRTTLNRNLAPLLQKELIVERGQEESSGGRKPSLFDVNTKKYVIYGVEISQLLVRVGFFDLHFHALASQIFYMAPDYTPEDVCKKIAEILSQFLEDTQYTREEVLCIGVGVFGPYSQKDRTILPRRGTYLPKWNIVPIGQMLEDALQAEVYVNEGLNTINMYQYLYDNENQYRNIALFTDSVLVRSSVICNGRLLLEVGDEIDGLAHMAVEKDGLFCYCGNRGCLEQYASLLTIVSNYNMLKRNEYKDMKPFDAFLIICGKVEEHEPEAVQVITDAAKYFAQGILNFIRIFNLEKIQLSGSVVYSCKLFYHTCREYILRNVPPSLKEVSMPMSVEMDFGLISLSVAVMSLRYVLNSNDF